MSARSVSRWLLTELYSPVAIDIAPAAPANPATMIDDRDHPRRHADEERGDRHDAVAGAEHVRAAIRCARIGGARGGHGRRAGDRLAAHSHSSLEVRTSAPRSP
jgi:hypothetical protein